MKTITQRFTYTVCAILAVCSLMAFKAYHNENSKNYIEKIYTQTDRSFYFPGETIWFKSYVVLEDNSVSNISDIVNAQLISPKGAVIKTLKLAMKDGYVYGNFHVNDDWLGGQYTLKVFTNWMRNFGDEHLFTKKLTIQKIVNPNLLLKLKFEKEGYGINSEVFANFEVKDLKNQPLSNHEIAYVVSVKGEKIISKTILTDASGKATPNFLLPKDLNSTDVTLNILIPYNGTTESISRSVPVTLDNLDLQFFPESGKIIAGTQNTVAFKAMDEFGKPVDVAGDILNADGQIITEFSSFHDGMGCVSLHAETGENYVAKLKSPFVSERQIKLPKVYKNGTKFSVKIHKSEAEVMVHTTEKKPLVLEVTSASKVLLQKKISTKHRSFRINTESFPMGITKFSIKNTSGHIEAERLVFVNAHKQLCINIDIDKSTYQAREKVKLAITTKDGTGKPLPSNLSIAVADNKLVSFADDQQDHILSYLLMSSELKGNIHKPGYYFNPTKAKSYQAIDYVMLTHGWRDYQHKSFDNAQYMPDHHAIQTGTIVDKKGNPMFARLLLLDNQGNQVLLFETEPDGSFAFKFKEKTSLVLLAFRDDGKPVFIKKTDLINASYESDNMLIEQENKEIPRPFERFQKPTDKIIKKKARVAVSMNEDTNNLDEVIIEAYSLLNSASKTAASITTISAESIENRPYASVAQTLQGQIAGLQITSGSGQPGANTTVLLRGSSSMSGHNEPLFVVDGVPVNQNIIGRLSASEIKQITIIKDASATALYGCRAANGVVVISTNTEGYINNYGKKKLNSKRFNNYAIQHFYHNKNRHLDK
ncbi:MAG: TonB-dependent receptor plug domain-containing protein, partial [Algicola sp.]|nr:TonB-dependent receptor plug domain-containing protein [Algicola sp.]